MGTTAPEPSSRRGGTLTVAFILLAGAVVSVSLGVYGRLHEPSGKPLFTLGSENLIVTKSVLTSVVLFGALVQLVLALRLFGRIGSGPAPGWVGPTHRVVGAVTVLLSLPIAASCLSVLGFQATDARVLVHSLLGCLFYGTFVAKVLGLHVRGAPGWLVPWLGGLLFTTVVALWLTSALWYFTNVPGGPSY